MNVNIKNVSDFITVFNGTGLKLDAFTGGCYHPSLIKITKESFDRLTLHVDDQALKILSVRSFHKSIKMTESALNITLFSNN